MEWKSTPFPNLMFIIHNNSILIKGSFSLPAHGSGGARATIKMIAPQKFFPRNKDGSAGGGWGEECRAVRAQKPRYTAQKLLGQNLKKKNILSFLEEIRHAQIRKSKERFSAGHASGASGGAVYSSSGCSSK